MGLSPVAVTYLLAASSLNQAMTDRGKKEENESEKIWISQEWKELFQ